MSVFSVQVTRKDNIRNWHNHGRDIESGQVLTEGQICKAKLVRQILWTDMFWNGTRKRRRYLGVEKEDMQ